MGQHAETGRYDLYTMRVDGTGIIPVTHDEAYEYKPGWSPDGAYIVFTRQLYPEPFTLSRIRPDGSELTSILIDRLCDGRLSHLVA